MNSSSHQDVENLTAVFDYLHASSCGKTPCFLTPEDSKRYLPNMISKSTYEPQNPKYSVGGRRVTREPGVINEEAVHCRSCQKDHATYAYNYCPRTPCTTCFKTGHVPFDCPFLRKIPKDAEFDRANYEITCQCGNLFNVNKWICTRCPASVHPLLQRKFCDICCEFTQHSFYECPKDKVRAAANKFRRDLLLSRPRFLFVGEEEEASTSQRENAGNVTFIDEM